VKKLLFIAVCAAFMVSCASKRAAIVDSAIIEAETLRELAKANNLVIPTSTDSIITAAKKQQEERQTESAFVLADEAILKQQIYLLKQEQSNLSAMKTAAESDLTTSKESLDIYHNVLQDRKNAPKEQVLNK